MSLFLKIFRGVKYSVKNIHIRFEDDYFCPKNPFSTGISIRNISLETDFEQEKIERTKNLSSIVKMQQIQDVGVYWNSKSEMIVPTSIWESSEHLEFGVFELIDADTIQSLMKDIFSHEFGLSHTFLVDPLTYRMQISLRSEYTNLKDDYKYRISMWLQKVQLNLNPSMAIDFLGYHQHLEMQSYLRDLQKYRPHIRIKTFIEFFRKFGVWELRLAKNRRKANPVQAELLQKYDAVVKDWFRYALWFVRLKRASRSMSATMAIRTKNGIFASSTPREQHHIPLELLRIQKGLHELQGKPYKGKESKDRYGIGKILEFNERFNRKKKQFQMQNRFLTSAQHKEVCKERHGLYSELKRQVKQQALEADSDDDGLGYHDSSSEDEEEMEITLTEAMEQQSQVFDELGLAENGHNPAAEKSRTNTSNQEELPMTKDELKHTLHQAQQQLSKAKNLRKFLGGVQFHIYLDGVRVNIFGGKNAMTYQGNPIPRFFFDLHQLDTSLVFENNETNESLQHFVEVNIKQLKLVDNYVPERILEDDLNNQSSPKRPPINQPNMPQVSSVRPSGDTATLNRSFQNSLASGVFSLPHRQSVAKPIESISMKSKHELKDDDFFNIKHRDFHNDKFESQIKTSNLEDLLDEENKLNEFEVGRRIKKRTIASFKPPLSLVNTVRTEDLLNEKVMANPKLQFNSNVLITDQNQILQQRCFLLFQGFPDDQADWNPNNPIPPALDALRLRVQFHKQDDAAIRHQLKVTLKVDNFITELRQELVLSLTELLPDYFRLQQFADLFPNPFSTDFVSMRTSLHRKLKLWAAMLYVRDQTITKTNFGDPAHIRAVEGH